MSLTAAQYVKEFDKIGVYFIGIPAPSSITGTDYAVGIFSDGVVLRVKDEIVDYISLDNNNCLMMNSNSIADKLARIGRLLAGLSQETRAKQLKEMGCEEGKTLNIDGSLWNRGEYLGLWDRPRWRKENAKV